MTLRREPSTPPRIPGYSHSRLLGTGGFADVFLYQQQMPRRLVAVKVLLASALGDEVRARFRAEADLMAKLSHHPSIVTIYQADVAPDGRPYLVMEYCSRPGLGQRYRTERMAVAEVLRIGVRLACAVETAHRAGVLHRDIKPANVLVTDFGWPALTDFGIAATTGWSSGAAVGMSIPWSPPEMLAEDPTGDVRADIYSLAATVYSLLARRSPFEVPDGANSAADLLARIERVPLGPTGRGDVPYSLQTVLARAMDKAPERRYPTALALARALQQVEAELLLPLTPLDLPEDIVVADPRDGTEDEPDGAVPVDDQPTRLRPVQSITPDALSAARGDATAQPSPGATARDTAAADAAVEAEHHGVPEAWRRQAEAVAGTAGTAGAEVETRHRWRRVLGTTLAGAVVVAVLVVAGVLALRPTTGPGTGVDDLDPAPTSSGPAVVRAVPSPTDLEGTPADDGSVTFTWTNPDPQEGDEFLWGLVVPGGEPTLNVVSEPTVTVGPPDPTTPAASVCIEVSVVRSDGRYSTAPAVGCAPS